MLEEREVDEILECSVRMSDVSAVSCFGGRLVVVEGHGYGTERGGTNRRRDDPDHGVANRLG